MGVKNRTFSKKIEESKLRVQKLELTLMDLEEQEKKAIEQFEAKFTAYNLEADKFKADLAIVEEFEENLSQRIFDLQAVVDEVMASP